MEPIHNIDYTGSTTNGGLVVTPEETGGMAGLVREMLYQMGEDPDREGLQRTPERVARMYAELLSGYHTDLKELLNGALFESEHRDLVVVRNVKFYSLCEHHLLPFFGQAHVAYLPAGKIIGLSKIPRLVEMYARRLQVQERLARQVADTLHDLVRPRGVAVLVEGAHLCAMMRGVKKDETRMLTTARTGVFETDPSVYQDFLSHLALPNSEDGWLT